MLLSVAKTIVFIAGLLLLGIALLTTILVMIGPSKDDDDGSESLD
jgi:hypothetical protein